MSMRLQVTHTTGYVYDAEVQSSYNEARIIPQTGLNQLTLSSHVLVSPDIIQRRYWDYWGSQVTVFDVHVPHTEMSIVSTSVVDTADSFTPSGGSWEEIEAVRDEFVELLGPSSRTALDEEMKAVASEASGSPYEVLLALSAIVHDRVEYVPGSTGVQTSATEAWHQRKGVCQDIAHVTLALLREAGVPARYVSGYLHPGKDPQVGEAVKGESHAWVEAWLGGWWGFDPTNGVPAGQKHVTVARGRDYADVPPLKGVYAGGGLQSLSVGVEVTRLS